MVLMVLMPVLTNIVRSLLVYPKGSLGLSVTNKPYPLKHRLLSHLSTLMARTALLLLADGAEEMEVVITADVLRRAGVSMELTAVADITSLSPCNGNGLLWEDVNQR